MDAIPPSTLPDAAQSTITPPYQQLMGDFTWLSISTRPDITAILSLLSEHTHKPSKAHLDYALFVVRYLASTTTVGLIFSSSVPAPLQAFVQNKDAMRDLGLLCDANWSPKDATTPKPRAPIAWGCIRHKTTAQSSCEAEVHSLNKATKLVIQLKILFRDLDLPITSSVPIF